MTTVAGDFYDYLVANENQAGILVADVSGHGVPAALIAAMVKLVATTQHVNAAAPAELLAGMNAALCGNTQEQFVTAAYVYLDAETANLRYSAAAHPPMLLVRGGAVREIVENGLMLAAFPSATFSTADHPLQPGDRLVLYTDGILEAADARKEEFGQAPTPGTAPRGRPPARRKDRRPTHPRRPAMGPLTGRRPHRHHLRLRLTTVPQRVPGAPGSLLRPGSKPPPIRPLDGIPTKAPRVSLLKPGS
jgi:hypothetical protein